MKQNKDIIYGLNDRPPFLEAAFAALQHLFAIFVAIMTPPLIIASQIGLDIATTSYLVSMALLASGISTFIQCRKFGPVGTGLLCIQGTSFSFIGPIITAGMSGGLSVIFGSCMAASFVEIFIGRLLKYARKIITPVVSGIVVTLIGLCLIKVGISACGGGNAAMANGTFGSLQNLGLSVLVLVVIVVFNSCRNRYLRMSSIVIGIVVGYVTAWLMGMIDFSSVRSYGGFYLPVPFKYGLSFDLSAFISLSIIFVITAIEAYGDITANSLISGEPVEGEVFTKRASGGVVANGVSSLLSGMLNSFPNSIFAQNNGMIQLTGVASRYVGYFISAFLVILGVFPAVSLVFSLMPEPVLGGATLLMFGTVATAGIRIIASQPIGRKEILVIAVSLALGLSVEMVPNILAGLPDTLRSIFSSGITTGGVAAIVSNLLIRVKDE
ncbi:MAG: nucleobase:cation symporter-2 family protein [Prevotella sp.]|nr:nucleobase:cation symporter-2 family protein [Prevotella sp.]